jgi:glucosamine-6-phosphate deaminase
VKLKIFDEKLSLSRTAAKQAAAAIRMAIFDHSEARVVAATGASQLVFLEALTDEPDIDWSRVEVFHLDEYVGLPMTHPGSFRKMLLENLIQKTGITKYHLVDGDGNLSEVLQRVNRVIASAPVDIAFLGIGENGHLAFKDPPADFEIEDPYLIVTLRSCAHMPMPPFISTKLLHPC